MNCQPYSLAIGNGNCGNYFNRGIKVDKSIFLQSCFL